MSWCKYMSLVITIIILICTTFAQSFTNGFEICTPQQQQDIPSSPNYPCDSRLEVVDLNYHIVNLTEVIRIIPDMVQVARCGGNCVSLSHRCVPTSQTLRSVPVMFVMSTMVNNIYDQTCGNVSVVEHESCECGCPMTEEDCYVKGNQIPERIFDPDHCKCRCINNLERTDCTLAGREWNENFCKCMCPRSSWHHCSTGYTFDHEHSCRCVAINLTASTGLIAALVVVATCILVSTVGLYTMYKRQIGLFKNLRKDERLQVESQRLSLNSRRLPEQNTKSVVNFDTT